MRMYIYGENPCCQPFRPARENKSVTKANRMICIVLDVTSISFIFDVRENVKEKRERGDVSSFVKS